MKDRYDFSKGKRGRVLPTEPEPAGKTRITIRLDQDIVDRFFRMAEETGGATGYQTLINGALREYLDGKVPRVRGDAATHHSGGVEIERCLNSNLVKSLAAPRCALDLQLHLFEWPGYPGPVGNLLVRMRGLEPPLPCEN
jgi:uncharacterized protein (DUF4415 family)